MKTVQTFAAVAAVLALAGAGLAGGQTPSVPVAADSSPGSSKLEGLYSGPWVTTKNKKLDGTTNCQVKQLSKDRWQGRFWGVWQQVPFDYTVEFGRYTPEKVASASKENGQQNVRLVDVGADDLVTGKAMIEGASYVWTGRLTLSRFDIVFTGSRYEGHLELTRVQEKKPQP